MADVLNTKPPFTGTMYSGQTYAFVFCIYFSIAIDP